jgi:hypothetical protein
MPMTSTLDTKSRELLERIAKEIGRYSASQAGTMRKGQIAQVSSALDVMLRYSIQWICEQERIDPATLATRAESLRKATGGQLIAMLRELGRHPAAQRIEVKVLCREAAQRGSRLDKFVNLRNNTLHSDAEAPAPSVVLPILESLRGLFVAHRRTAGWEGDATASPKRPGSKSSRRTTHRPKFED